MLRHVARDWKDSNTADAQKQYFKEHLIDYYGGGDGNITTGEDGQNSIESPGRWVGKVAKLLGLGEKVSILQYEKLSMNRDPSTNEKLKPRDIKFPRLNEELVIAPPKSVSLAWGLLGDERVKEAHAASVSAMLCYMEEEVAARKRAGLAKNSVDNETTGKLLASVFEHETARAVGDKMEDMFLHSHILLWNYTQVKDGTWKAAELGKVLSSLPFYEAVYHATLAEKLQKLGYALERKGDKWELAGFSQGLIDKFSKRNEQVKKEGRRLQDKLGRLLSGGEKDKLGERTRGKKYHRDINYLKQRWAEQLSKKEKREIGLLHVKVEKGQGHSLDYKEENAGNAVIHTEKMLFERKSVVKAPHFMAKAIMQGIGTSNVEQVIAAVKNNPNLHWGIDRQGIQEISTHAIIKEEASVIQAFRKGIGTMEPLVKASDHYVFKHPLLEKANKGNIGQREAVRHVIASKDRFTLIKGRAGVGKTTSSQELAGLLKDSLVAFAPTTGAVEVLRKDGFKEVHTTQMLEKSRSLQRSAKGKVWLIDEAGLLSGTSMYKLTQLAEKQEARVVLMGDATQHESVARGNPFRLVSKWMQDSMQVASIDHIWRQQGDYKKAVEAITKGDTQASLETLKKLDWVHEKKTDIYQHVAEKYVSILQQNMTVAATAPIHREKHQVSKAIRNELKQKRYLGKREQVLEVFKSKNWTQAEKEDVSRYEEGQVIKFAQNTKGGFVKSAEYLVRSVTGKGLKVMDKKTGTEKLLPLMHAVKFQVFEKEKMPVAKGELLLVNANSKKDKVYNGQVLKVKKIDRKNIIFDNGTLLSKGFGHFTYAYTRTSHSIQGSTINHILPVISGDSHQAAGLKQWYVDVSRGNKSCQVFTDDLDKLELSIGRKQEEKAALEMRPMILKENKKFASKIAI